MATFETMSIEERYKHLRLMQPQYRQADQETNKRLLDEMETFTGLHRKSLIRRLKHYTVTSTIINPVIGPEAR